MHYSYHKKEYIVKRYPISHQSSLKAWNTADEHILNYLEEENTLPASMIIIHDRFGFLTTVLSSYNPISTYLLYSQRKSISSNLLLNKNSINDENLIHPLQSIHQKIDIGLIKIPKSAELFRLYLAHLQKNLHQNSTVIAAFMTKYFSKQSLEIAQEYFEEVTQSKAWKKSRLLILKKPKILEHKPLIHQIHFNNHIFQQYYGVFSAKNIDYASQFLINHLDVKKTDELILDVGCGNGILAWFARKENQTAAIHLMDDNYLAIESAKLNMTTGINHFHFSNHLPNIEKSSFDLVISNPPFHFEHETNIEISIQLFKEIKDVLKENGRFHLVANKHLNYKTHLMKIFSKVEIAAENNKFVVYYCLK